MSADSSKLTLPLWAHGIPPAGLSDEWTRFYRALLNPLRTLVSFRDLADPNRSATRDLLITWEEALHDRQEMAGTVLRSLHGRFQRTWRVGQRILEAVTSVRGIISSAARYMAKPCPSGEPRADENRTRWENETRCLWEEICKKLNEFDAEPLVDELAAAVVADCNAQRWVASESVGMGDAPAAAIHQGLDKVAQGKGKPERKHAGGKRPLNESDPGEWELYMRICREHKPGEQHVETLRRMKEDKHFCDQATARGVKLNPTLVRNAIALLAQRRYRRARNKQQTRST
jgi:hypothetical protein